MESESFLSVTSAADWRGGQEPGNADWLHLAADRLLYVTRAVERASTLQHLMQAVAEASIGIGGAESAGVYLLNDDQVSFTVGWEATAPEWPGTQRAGVRLQLGQWHGMMRALEQGAAVAWVRGDEFLSTFEQDHYEKEGVGSGIDLPLVCAGETVGFLKLFRRAQDVWSGRDVTIATMIGSTISLALVSERLLEQARQQSSDQEALARIAQVAITQREPRDLLQRVANEIRNLLPFQCVDIELWSPDQDRCEIVAHSAIPDWPSPTGGVVFYRLSDWPVNLRTLREMRMVTLDAREGLIDSERAYLSIRQVKQLHIVPLVYAGRCLGAIVLHARERTSFDARLRALIAEVAAITALAAHAARSLRESQWERQAQAWQLRLNNALLNDAPLQTMLDEALASLVEMTQVSAALIAIEHPHLKENGERRLAVSNGLVQSTVKNWNFDAWSIVLDARRTQELQVTRINEQSISAPDASMLSELGQEWVLAAPLLHDKQSFGVLLLVYPSEFVATDGVLSFIRTMARQVALVASDQMLREEQRHTTHWSSSMLKVAQASVAGSDLDTLLRVIARTCLELHQVDACEIEKYDPESELLINHTLVVRDDWRMPYQPEATHSTAEWPIYREIIAGGRARALSVDGPDLEPHESAYLRDIGVQHAMMVPLLMGEEMLGLLTLYRVDPAPFSPRSVTLTEELAAQAALALGRAQLFDALHARAESDGVTGLLNHRAILERIDQALSEGDLDQHPVSLMLIDLDNFKLLNDFNGHLTGDRYLREMAELIQQTIGARGEVARYGGDEFLVLLPDTDLDDCNALAHSLLSGSHDVGFEMSGYRVPFQFSIGTASAPRHGATRDQLIKMADRAMYDAKEQGGGRLGAADGPEPEQPPGTYSALAALVQVIDRKDRYTSVHSDRVAAIAVHFAIWLGRSEQEIEALYIAGQLHDVGKIAVPDALLSRPGRLNPEEQERLQQHVKLSEMMIKDVPQVDLVAAAVGAHHERWDGDGYPRGLKGAEIPELGRLLAIADAVSAMTQDRPYAKARPLAEALAELAANRGKQFDPDMVDAFLRFAETGALADKLPVPSPASLTGMSPTDRG